MSFSLKDKKPAASTIVIIALLTLAITLILKTFLMNDTIEEKSQKYYHTYVENKYLRIFDTYDTKGSGFTQALKQKGFLSRLKNFNQDLHTTDGLNYMEVFEQQVEHQGRYDGKDIFVVAYDMDPSMKNQLIKTPSGQIYITPLYAVQVDSTAYDYFLKDNLAIGKNFIADDYNYRPDKKKSIPCILGSNYSTIYDLGDRLQVNYLFKTIDLQIIGFFDITASIPMNGSILYLDKYIIMPSLSCEYNPNSPEEEFFQIILYDQKNSGYIVDEGRDYFTLVNNIAKSVNLQYTVRNDKKDVNMVNQGVTALLTKKVIEAISILLLMIVIIIFIFVLMQKFHRDAQKISVNLICGASLNRIKARLFLHVIFCYLASLFISMLLIGKDLFSISYRNTTICLTVLLLSLISVILILNLLINNYQLGTALRRR